jgi:thiamine-phosphate pyrophosphorylase
VEPAIVQGDETLGQELMMRPTTQQTRLYLVVPAAPAEGFAARLEETLAAGDIAAVLIGCGANEVAAEEVAEPLVPIVQRAGAAALIAEHTRIAGRLKADGVHIGSGLGDLREAVRSFRPKRIVGAGGLSSRHAAMEAGEADIDYVFFGRPHGDTHDEPHPKALELAEWWSDVMQVPAVVMAGRSLDSVATAAATGAAFVALHEAVWAHAGGPAEAVRQALTRLASDGRRAA